MVGTEYKMFSRNSDSHVIWHVSILFGSEVRLAYFAQFNLPGEWFSTEKKKESTQLKTTNILYCQ